MNKITVIVNDYASNVKSFIAFDGPDIEKMVEIWDEPDERLVRMQVLPSFAGYEKWSELTPAHFRLLITRSLNSLAELKDEERSDIKQLAVSATNFLILAFIICLENNTSSEIEHFRINRFDEMNVTFDYSATFELSYDRPMPKNSEPMFSIVVDNTECPE